MSTWTPTIVDPQLRFRSNHTDFAGAVGVVGHYSAGPIETSTADLLAKVRGHHAQHQAQGWAGLGYHFVLGRRGEIVLGRPTLWLGAGVAGHNAGTIHVCCLGDQHARPTIRQGRALRWLLTYGHRTSRLERAHRLPWNALTLPRRVHRDLAPTACPGPFLDMYRADGSPLT